MKKTFYAMITVLVLATSGITACSTKTGAAAGGAVGGAAAGGGVYEYRMNEELKRLDDELKSGKITQEEYNIRKDEVHRMSLIEKS